MFGLFRRLGSRDAKPNPDAFWSDKWGWMDEASPADLLAVVRRGVESGTIKGERIVLDGASVGKDVPDDLIELVFYVEREKGVEWFRRGGDFILVPVSDGGSET